MLTRQVVAESPVSLIVAALDLQLVRLLRGAMAGSAKAGCRATPLGPAPGHLHPDARPTVEPAPRFEPRPVVHPTPRFEPRPVIHPKPAEAPQAGPPLNPEKPRPLPVVFEPPWKVLPWEIPAEPAPKVKLIVHRPDVKTKGTMLDVFI